MPPSQKPTHPKRTMAKKPKFKNYTVVHAYIITKIAMAGDSSLTVGRIISDWDLIIKELAEWHRIYEEIGKYNKLSAFTQSNNFKALDISTTNTNNKVRRS